MPSTPGPRTSGARLVVRVDAAGEKTRVGALLAIVQEALSRKPALLRTTDLLARRFVQVLLVLASSPAWRGSTRAPRSRSSASSRCSWSRARARSGSRCRSPSRWPCCAPRASGVFIKNPDALERLRKVDTVLLDKTGTLTEGRATVARWQGDDAVLEFARALEAESAHAVALAFQRSYGTLDAARANGRTRRRGRRAGNRRTARRARRPRRATARTSKPQERRCRPTLERSPRR